MTDTREKPEETFTPAEVVSAIRAFLEYGEQSYDRPGGHKGYFSHCGWAARCLRWHLRHAFVPQEDSRK